jgi:hypothetical protein
VFVKAQQRRQAEARTEAIKSTAARLRAEFRSEGSTDLLEGIAALPLFSRERRQKLSNLLVHFADHPGLSTFDYQYYQSSGKSGHYVRQTVACMDLEPGRLPAFTLAPETIVDKIAARFGGQDIDFEQQPGFSARYRLQSTNEDATRRLFTPALMSWLEGQNGYHVECTGRRILWYRLGEYAAPEAMEQFIGTASELFRRFITD